MKDFIECIASFGAGLLIGALFLAALLFVYVLGAACFEYVEELLR